MVSPLIFLVFALPRTHLFRRHAPRESSFRCRKADFRCMPMEERRKRRTGAPGTPPATAAEDPLPGRPSSVQAAMGPVWEPKLSPRCSRLLALGRGSGGGREDVSLLQESLLLLLLLLVLLLCATRPLASVPPSSSSSSSSVWNSSRTA